MGVQGVQGVGFVIFVRGVAATLTLFITAMGNMMYDILPGCPKATSTLRKELN